MQSLSPIHYDSNGRQMEYVETPIQRRERIAFLRRREWAKRMSDWLENSNSVSQEYRRDILYDSAMSTQPTRPKTTWDISLPNYDDDEPYIIYSSSSSTSSPSSSTSALTDDSSSPSTSPMLQHPLPHLMAKTHRRKRSSLSSINEEPEEM